jgi:hypothetical protein
MRPLTVFAAFALSSQVLAGSAAFAAVPQDGRLDFTVLRNGDKIGRHEMIFRDGANGLQVDIKTDIKVKVLFVTAYKFEHEGHEIWKEGRLVRLWSETDDDGKHHELEAQAQADALAVNGDAARGTVAAQIIPASLWNEGILQGGTVLNTLDGKSMAIQVQDLGQENVDVHGKATPARHYVVSGDLKRELWFDERDVLVKVRFKAEDDSTVEYVLR